MKTAATPNTRLVDEYFKKYAESYQNTSNKLIYWLCLPLIVFSLLGLVWSVPFPYLKLLDSFNGMFNWASFLMAFAVYYYYRLSPVLSYLMLLVMMLFCYIITLLVNWQETGGPYLWQTCLAIFVFSWIGQTIERKMEGKKSSFLDDLKFILIGPIWLLHFILNRFGIKY